LARPTACRQSIELRGSTLYRSIYAYIGVGVMRVRFAWTLPIAAAAILLITMGGRQTIGLFIAPLDEATGLGIVAISLAVAIGQFVFAPLVQMAIVGFGWANAMLAVAAAMLTTLPLAWPLRRRHRPAPPASVGTPASEAGTGLWRQLAMAARDRSYWWLNLGFF